MQTFEHNNKDVQENRTNSKPLHILHLSGIPKRNNFFAPKKCFLQPKEMFSSAQRNVFFSPKKWHPPPKTSKKLSISSAQRNHFFSPEKSLLQPREMISSAQRNNFFVQNKKKMNT
jgi:hypothetical protein